MKYYNPRYIFVICTALLYLSTGYAHAESAAVGVSPELAAQIRFDASTLSQTQLSTRKIGNATVEHWSTGWKNGGFAAYWRGIPDKQPKGVIFFVTGTTVDNLEETAARLAQADILFIGLSWVDLISDQPRYQLFSGEFQNELLAKAAACALALANNIKRAEDVPALIIGASNGGIIASLVNELATVPLDGIIYYMSSGGFSLAANNQSRYYADYPDYAKELDPLYISTKSNVTYAVISTNDMYFPFKQAYAWLYTRTNGNVLVVENQNHQAPETDLWSLSIQLIENIEYYPPPPSPTQINIVPQYNFINWKISITWEGVEIKNVLYSIGTDPMFCYFFNIYLLDKLRQNNFLLLVHGIRRDINLPISYFIRVISENETR